MTAYAVNVDIDGGRFRATVDRSGSVTTKRGHGGGVTEREAIRNAWANFWARNG